MPSIKDKAMLVEVSVSYWTNAVHDSSVVTDIMKKTKTEEDVHRYKKVLIKPEALAQVKAARVALRAHWWAHTLPWGNAGVRILPSHKFQSFAEKLRELQNDYDNAVRAFVSNYPKMKAEARRRLGSLFNEDDFPSIERIKRKFGCTINYSPIPDAEDFRVDLSEDEKKRLAKEIEKAVADNTRGAMVALIEKLQDVIETLADRMKEDDPAIRESLIGNIKEACEEVASFNIVDDKQVEAFRKAAETLTKGIEVDKLKEDKKARKELASKADEVLKKMAGYIGGGA